MWLITKTSTTADSEGGAPLTDLGQGLNSLTLAQHDSMVDGLELFRPSAGASSDTSEITSLIGSELKARNNLRELTLKNLGIGDGHVWVGQTKNKNHAAGNAYTGYDSHGIGHPRYRSPSTVGSSEILGDIRSAESPGYSVSVNLSTHLVLPDSNVPSNQEPNFPNRQVTTITPRR